jgi:CRISP-associated protein Cas1
VRISDLTLLPRFADGLTFLYAEHVRVDQDGLAICLRDKSGEVPVPVAALSVLMLGPGTSITHAAMVACADNGCSVLFCGEAGVRLYACGMGETKRAHNLLAQARAWADTAEHLRVVHRLYRTRFDIELPEDLSLEQVRGKEGVRVRDMYAAMAKETGITWTGRAYRRDDWASADPVNRALSTANACLYGLCHAGLVATGFSPALGFIHSGKSLAFVYDVADLYKCDVTIPIAFRAAAEGPVKGLETRVRKLCREEFRKSRLLERIVPDVLKVLGLTPERAKFVDLSGEDDDAPSKLWDPDGNTVEGGHNYAPVEPLPDDGIPF